MTHESRPISERFVRFKTLFLSDVHLGTPDCKVHEVNDLLRRSRCEKLVLNGDIIDAWHLSRRRNHWTTAHTRFIRLVLRKLEKENTEVVYLRGNHDDLLHRFLPLRLARLSIVNEHVHQTPQGDYLVVHGDGFDQVTTHHPWIARLGAIGYDQLLRLNRIYNWWRRLRGKEYFSLSKAIKARVKQAISFTGRYEEQLQGLATGKNCRGIICGHIHTPADKIVGTVHYLNSGDWVESLTCVVEHLDRRLEVIHYRDFLTLAGPAPASTSTGTRPTGRT
ncbi:MAG: UDP-2,3-diacylglucosamine diphosphatase [Verrucomicrobiales bacterium]